ncbi:neutral zinc metallopeptidase [Sphingomonas sabuli]|uniref:Neutral zinc metallopeptidase n=1 Tax=Sphingomonas sabuli TaxID=2764186 RepID=A0A7G9L5C3_9SPHN|nr:neutral zinc metallopeptidase [Sphingomonas sabuli]QNM83822.1 neutral zinc metallopeptidase [Sphingomonas sabuli]
MRLGDDDSGNFIDRTGQGGGFNMGGGGGMLGCLLPLVMSRFGIIGVLVLLLGYCALQSIGGGSIIPGGGGGGGGSPSSEQSSTDQSTLSPENRRVLSGVLASTEQVWGQLFQKSGSTYAEPKMVAYSNYDQTGCGMAQSAVGPFYCPTDQRIYIDPKFFDELSSRFGAPGDFAQGYVIAHEVGHHVQNLTGTLDKAERAQASSSRVDGNAIQVGVELQADCYAGVWAANARTADGQPILEPGDIEEGMRAAEAIGDDTLQQNTQGRVVPESFTHGSSAQRMAALRKGLETGDPAACDFNR